MTLAHPPADRPAARPTDLRSWARAHEPRPGRFTPTDATARILTLDLKNDAAALPMGVDRCAWPRRGLPPESYLDETGRIRGACNCECGCRRRERKYLRCERCGRGRHEVGQVAPVIPLAARAAMAFGDFGFRPTDAEAARIRARLDYHLELMRSPAEEAAEDSEHARPSGHGSSGDGVRRVASG